MVGRRCQGGRWARGDDSWGHQAKEEVRREGERTREEGAGINLKWVCSPVTLASTVRCIEENESKYHVLKGMELLYESY